MIKKEINSKKSILDIKPGDTIRVYQIIKESVPAKKGKEKEIKEKIQIFEGLVLARKHGSEPGATITVRKVIDGVGEEKIFPLHSPIIKEIEIVKRGKVRRAKLYYLREAKGKRARLKTQEFQAETVEEPKTPETLEAPAPPAEEAKKVVEQEEAQKEK